MTFQPPPGQSCSELLKEADLDRRAGRHTESLEKHVWFFDNSRNAAGMGGVRLSFALSNWMQLAAVYQPAMAAITNLRDRTEAQCRSKPGDFKAFHELSALNRYLDKEDNTVSVFVDIASTDMISANVLYSIAEPLLVARGMYHQCGPFLEIDNTIKISISAYETTKKLEDARTNEHEATPLAEKMFRARMTRLVFLLVSNDRESDARLVMNRSLETIDSNDFRSDLEEALLGHLPEK